MTVTCYNHLLLINNNNKYNGTTSAPTIFFATEMNKNESKFTEVKFSNIKNNNRRRKVTDLVVDMKRFYYNKKKGFTQ